MSSPVVTVPEDATVREAAKIMAERGFSGLVVKNRAGKGVGVVTAADIVRFEVGRACHVVSDRDHARLSAKARERGGDELHLEFVEGDRVQDIMTPFLFHMPARATVAARIVCTKDNVGADERLRRLAEETNAQLRFKL